MFASCRIVPCLHRRHDWTKFETGARRSGAAQEPKVWCYTTQTQVAGVRRTFPVGTSWMGFVHSVFVVGNTDVPVQILGICMLLHDHWFIVVVRMISIRAVVLRGNYLSLRRRVLVHGFPERHDQQLNSLLNSPMCLVVQGVCCIWRQTVCAHHLTADRLFFVLQQVAMRSIQTQYTFCLAHACGCFDCFEVQYYECIRCPWLTNQQFR